LTRYPRAFSLSLSCSLSLSVSVAVCFSISCSRLSLSPSDLMHRCCSSRPPVLHAQESGGWWRQAKADYTQDDIIPAQSYIVPHRNASITPAGTIFSLPQTHIHICSSFSCPWSDLLFTFVDVLAEFVEDFVSLRRPVVIKGLASQWPGRKRWRRDECVFCVFCVFSCMFVFSFF
jgi:hypothetical protein